MSILRILANRYLYITFLMLCNTFYLPAQTPVTREYQLKAVFLFNFTQFVEWPPTSFSTEQSPLIIGILGENPFGSFLEQTVAEEKINGHPVIVQYYNNAQDLKTCHILFINQAKNREPILAALKEKDVLTVSDTPDFLKQGGIIRFFTRNNKIQFQINLEASKAANLEISSKLLRLADIYVDKGSK